MSFPTNSLPIEFQQEHGTVDLVDDDDTKPDLAGGRDDGVEDEDLELDGAARGVWLCKIPKFLMEKWAQTDREGVELGRIRVYEELDAEGHNKVALLLDGEGGEDKPVPVPPPAPDVKGKGRAALRSAALAPPTALGQKAAPSNAVPNEYKLSMTNRASRNLFVFGEREEEDEESGEVGHRRKRRITSILGTVQHECSLTPSLSASYSSIMRERLRRAAEPKRKLQMLDVDRATANRLASGAGAAGVKGRVATFNTKKPAAAGPAPGTRYVRLPRPALLDLIFAQFATAPYWSLKALQEHVEQPQAYLREVLSEVGTLVPRGPYAGMWTLREEFRGGDAKGRDRAAAVASGAAGDQKPDVTRASAAHEDDEDDEMEIVE